LSTSTNSRKRRSRQNLFVFLLALSLLGAIVFSGGSRALRRSSDNGGVKPSVNIVSLGVPITQNFDTLATSGTANTWTDDSTLPGWYAQFTTPTTSPTTYRADAGGSNTGAIYSWGTGTSTERAFGSVSSGTPGTIYFALKLTNATGGTITSLDINFNGEQWRNGGNTSAQTLAFQYQVASPGTITDANTPTTGWTAFNALDFVSPTVGATPAALDGNAAANRTAKSANLPLTVNNGGEVWLRWMDINDTGNDHGLAIDDFSVTPNGFGATPTLNINDVTLNEGSSGGTTTFTFTVSLTAPAPVGGVTFDIATADGTAQDGNPAGEDNDYAAKTLTSQTISQGNTSYTFDVLVNADTVAEANETFFVNVTNITGATAGVTQGKGTILNDDANLSITDVSMNEGNAGPTSFDFTVNLSSPAAAGGVNFTVNTADGTATTANNDYTPIVNGSGSIAQGSNSTTISVPVNGDTTQEGAETFFVNLSNVTGANVIDGQGQGTIVNDDVTPPGVVISQIYGGGGNSGSTYKNDFIELYNSGATPVNLSGWSVQYTGATAPFAAVSSFDGSPLVTNLSGTIQPGHYFLVQEAAGAGGTTNLPAPDNTGTIAIGSTAGKIALLSNPTVLSGNCPGFLANGIVDFVGFAPTADCSETSPTAILSNTTAAIRNQNGCQDTDNNSNDFSVNVAIPRNSSNVNNCAAPGTLSASGSANPTSIDPGGSSLLTVTVTPAAGPPSTGITVTGDLSSIGGSATQQFYDDGTHGDATGGDNVFSFFATTPANASTGSKNIPFSVTDAQARNAAGTITISVVSPTCGVERWTVKVGTDPDAGLVNLNSATPVTIATMRGWPAPSPTPPTSRLAPHETAVYIINGTLIDYKEESDVDYHLVVQDGASNTVITEIPCPCCGIGSPFQPRMSAARQTFDGRLTATTSFQNPNIPVRVTGAGFFDFQHGQTGVAPNAIELHTILDITFPTTQTVFTTNGPNVHVQAGDVNIKFGNVSESGNTTVAPIDPSTAGPPLGGYSLVGPAFNITTNTSSSGPYNVCISVPYITDPAAFQNLKILHNEGGTLFDRTTGQDPVNKLVCATTSTLSPFVVALGQTPTAEITNVSGHIADADGVPIAGVGIRLGGTQDRLTITDAAGNYNFGGLEPNGFYNITPTRANYVFSPNSRSFSALGHHVDAAFNGSYIGARANPLDTTEYFVRQQYLDFLGREPEEAGLNGWVNTINNCASVDTRCDRVHVSEAFFRSLEFQERGYFLYRFYSTALGRKPDYAEFAPDLARVSGFLTSDQLEAAKAAFVNSFTVRPAFMARYDSLNNAEYVDALIRTAGVNLSDRQSMIDALNAGSRTRASVLRQIAESGEVYSRYYNQAFVVMEYFGYLQRDPDALYLNWIVTLDANPADSRRMVEGFVNAPEYRARFAR
jgi:hypothetical protein